MQKREAEFGNGRGPTSLVSVTTHLVSWAGGVNKVRGPYIMIIGGIRYSARCLGRSTPVALAFESVVDLHPFIAGHRATVRTGHPQVFFPRVAPE